MENTVVLPKIELEKRKHHTLFKFKFVNSARVLRVFHRLKNHRQHQLQRNQKIKQRIKQRRAHPKKVKKKLTLHQEPDDVMHHNHHQIQNNNCSSLLFSPIVQFQKVEKQKYLATFKDLIHKHVGTKVQYKISFQFFLFF